MKYATICGNLGRDWSKKDVGGYVVYENTMAVRSGKDGKETLWVKLTQWNEKGGEVLMKYTEKGSKLLVRGEIDVRAYIGKDTDAKAELSCRIDGFDLIGSATAGEAKEPQVSKPLAEELGDEIPFN